MLTALSCLGVGRGQQRHQLHSHTLLIQFQTSSQETRVGLASLALLERCSIWDMSCFSFLSHKLEQVPVLQSRFLPHRVGADSCFTGYAQVPLSQGRFLSQGVGVGYCCDQPTQTWALVNSVHVCALVQLGSKASQKQYAQSIGDLQLIREGTMTTADHMMSSW